MIRKAERQRSAMLLRGLWMVLITTAIVGCGSGNESPDTSVAVVDTSAKAAAVTDTKPPTKPRGVSGRPRNDATFRKYFDSLTFANNAGDIVDEHDFDCGDGSLCQGAQEVKIRIVPMMFANGVPWADALGTGEGHIVARINVLDNKRVGPLGLSKADSGYLWVGETSAGRTAAIYPIKKNGNVGNPKYLIVKDPCRDAMNTRPAVHMNPPVCASPGKSFPVAPGRKPDTASLGLVIPESIWVSCSEGCCRVDTDHSPERTGAGRAGPPPTRGGTPPITKR